MNAYLTLLKNVLPYKRNIFLFFICSILTVIFSLVSLVLLVPFLELLFDKTPLVSVQPQFKLSTTYLIQNFYYIISSKISQDGKVEALAFFCILVCIVFFLKNLFRYAAMYVLAPIRNRLIYDLRERMYIRLLKLPISFFAKNEKGDLITKFSSDLNEIEYSIMNTLETSIQSPMTIILFLGAMLAMSYQLTFFVFGMIIVMALVIGRIGKSLKRESKLGKEVQGRLISVIDETILGIKIIQSFSAQDWIYSKFQKENQAYYDTYNAMYRKRDLSSPLTEFLAIIVVCIVLWFGGNLVLNHGNLTAPIFISFMVVFSQLIPPAKSFSSAVYEIKKGMASYERIDKILNHPEINMNEMGKKIDQFQESLELKNLSFRYDESENCILEDINLTILPRKKYAIVGPSGAGKSTLMSLILGYYSPTSGQIVLDGVSLEDYNLESYRAIFGYVSQDSILFNYSIDENISFGINDPDKIQNSLDISNAIELKTRLQDEILGERGSKLSGGEKQRVTIARAAMKDPDIVLMDEATSALDSQNESEVQKAMDNLLKEKTSVVIAHRLSTVINSDQIILMQHGKIADIGMHSELYHRNLLYKKMVDLQKLD